MTSLLTIGTFDPPHLGHAAFLKNCERHADVITVGVNSDKFVLKYRGKPAIYTEDERRELIEELGYRTVLNDDMTGGGNLIKTEWPDVVAIGSDWFKRNYPAQLGVGPEFFEGRRISLIFIPYTPGISASSLKTRILESGLREARDGLDQG